MRAADYLRFAAGSLLRQRFRSLMMLLAMAIGVAAVTMLTAIGEGAKRFVEGEFAFLGKDTLIILPGRKETTGGLPPITGSTVRDITLEDAQYLGSHVRGIDSVAPLVVGSANIRHGTLARDTVVIGGTQALFTIRKLSASPGQILPAGDPSHPEPYCVIGSKLRAALFGQVMPVGQYLQVGDRRFMVIGELAGTGDSFGMDMSEGIIIPVASAQALFNTHGLFRVMVRIQPNANRDTVKDGIMEVMTRRHHGKPDITLVSPDAMLGTLQDILDLLTRAVAAIAGISLLVAGILVMNVTLINVSQRTREIGLLKAIGASSFMVEKIFLTEAAITATGGAVGGYLAGQAMVQVACLLWPSIPFHTPTWASIAALLVAGLTGMLFSLWPARKAGQLEPVDALRSRA